MQTSRRTWLSALSTAAVATTLPTLHAATRPSAEPFKYCLNTATIRGQKLTLEHEIDVAGKAGYNAIEPWIEKLEVYAKTGKKLNELTKRLQDNGLVVESAIGFPAWIVDDPTQRKKGLEDAKRAMDLVTQLGGKRLATPPVGATDSKANIDLRQAAARYRELLELGDRMGVVPQVEIWGFSKTLSKLGEGALVAIETGHPKACVLADVYHLYKGGSGFGGLKLLSAAGLQVFHVNDYPNMPREKINDKDRVYPGDGVAPLKEILKGLYDLGFQGVLSLELFNQEYYKQDALEVAKKGLQKMKTVAHEAVGLTL
ncbi:MAG TPA: sugar phosphate isomerase/epimerase [Gemmatales bacterium]|nr:sugar phosphate isomerase/epimerase [Gemmatales bacterium]